MATGGAAVEQLYNNLKKQGKANRKDRAYNISTSTRRQKQRPITAPVNRVGRMSKMRPSSSVSLPRTIQIDASRKPDTTNHSARAQRRIYYPGKINTELSPRQNLERLTSPVATATKKRPLTAKKVLGNQTDGEAKKSEVIPPIGAKEIRDFEILLERKHDALVSRIEQHLVNALCTASTKDKPQHLPNIVTEGMLTKIEKNQYSMLEQMTDIRRHSNKNETAVSDLSRTVARLQKKVVTELLQFAAVMSPSNNAAGDTPSGSGGMSQKQMDKMLQSVTKAVETSVASQLESVIDRKLKEHLEPLTAMNEKIDDIRTKTDYLIQRQAEIESNQNAMNDEIMHKTMYLESMIRTLGTLAGEFIQMGVEDIASTHRRSVSAIRSDIAKANKGSTKANETSTKANETSTKANETSTS